MKIWIIRHGMTRAQNEHLYCGSTDLPLTEKGKEDLRLKQQKICYPDAAGKNVYCSGMKRAVQTAEILFPGAEIITEPDFREMDFGDFECRRYDGDLDTDAEYIAWITGDNESNICPHGESSLMMKKRVLAAFEKVLASGKDSIIVCHGGPAAAVFAHYFPYSGLNYYQMLPKHGEGYCIEFSGAEPLEFSCLCSK